MTTRLTRLACAGAVALLSAAPAYAQGTGRPDRPYRGLFGGGVGETEQSLSASASISTSFDNQLIAGDTPAGEAAPSVGLFDGRGYASLSTGLSYSLSKDRVSMNASLGSSGQYVPNSSAPYVPNYVGAVGGSFRLFRRSSVSGNHSIALQPYNVLLPGTPLGEPVLGQAVPFDVSLGVRREEHIVQASSLGYSRQLGRRASISFNYGHSRNGSSVDADAQTAHSASARFSTPLTRGLGFYVGYSASQTSVGLGFEPYRRQNIDAGLDFGQSRGVTITRRTKLTFGMGTAAVTGSPDLRSSPHTTYNLTGNAMLTRELGRSWSASLGYNRGVGFVERFTVPFLSDSVGLSVGGLLGRRVQLNSGVNVAFSNLGLLYTGDSYRSYSASVSVSTALTRYLALSVSSAYYRYGFDPTVTLPTGVRREMGRRALSISLSTWAPLYNRGKGANASR